MSARELGWRWLAGAAALVLSICAVALLVSSRARADPLSTTTTVDMLTTTTGASTTGTATATSTTGTTTTVASSAAATSATTTTTATATAPSAAPPPAPAPAPIVAVVPPQQVSIAVAATPRSVEPLPVGFLGFSVEFSALHAYLGRNPAALNPVFLQLLSGIDQGHQPILRVGGNSTDNTWLPLPGVLPPLGVNYAITPDWLATVQALVRQTDARLILGVNLAADDPQIATVEARALVDAIGRHYIENLEVGNEPDLYLRYPWFYLPDGTEATRRAGGYTFRSYTNDLNHWRAIVPDVPLAAGALATLNWLGSLAPIAPDFPDVKTVSIHRYALTNCGVPTTSPLYPSVANLLSDASTSGLAAPLFPYAVALHGSGINLRVDELNSASCEGAKGVSDTFASALWIVDTLFNMAGSDVDGVNIHTLPGSNYAPFTFTQSGGTWSADVRPLYYGLLFFASAFPAGAEMLNSTDTSADAGGDVKSYTTVAPNGTLRTTIINEDATHDADVTLQLPSADPLTEETLTAPELTSTSGVALGGQSFAAGTTTGTLPAPATSLVEPANGSYSVVVPAGSAVLLTSTS